MGHRAQKNILRHGYKAVRISVGQHYSSESQRPAFTPKKGEQAKGRGYANVEKPHWRNPSARTMARFKRKHG